MNLSKEMKGRNIWFLLIIIIVTSFAIYHYNSTQSRFEKCCDVLANAHKEYISSNVLGKTMLHRDSVLMVDYDLLDVIKEEHSRMDSLIDLQTERMREEFSTLSLWASVLMIIFLIFSIYAMFKGDDLQNQGQRILDKVTKSADDAHSRISELDNRFNRECERLTSESNAILTDLKEQQKALLTNFTNEINEKKNEFVVVATEKTEQITAWLESIHDTFKALMDITTTDKEKDSDNI